VRAIILAAGRGSRIETVIGDHPKCLARVGSCTLLERQVRSLKACGVDRITVVIGYLGEQIEALSRGRFDVVRNPAFASTNSLYSLWLARDVLGEGVVVLNGDVLFHPQLLSDLLTARYEDAALIAAKGVGTEYSDEEMKVRVRGGLIVDMSKALTTEESDGENIGIAKFGAAGAQQLVRHLDRIVQAGELGAWAPRAFVEFSRQRALHAVDSRGLPWTEIDVPEDYWAACAHVLPAIEASDSLRGLPARWSTNGMHRAELGGGARHV
jgi:choline kinase